MACQKLRMYKLGNLIKNYHVQGIILSQLKEARVRALNGDVDEFIIKLLNSDKFDELTDKIAEKAARKIFDLDNIRISYNIKTRDEELPKRIEHKALRERIGDENLHAEEEKTKNHSENVEIQHIKPSNVTNEWNIKKTNSKEGLLPKERLRLKFKYLKSSQHNIKQQSLSTKNYNTKIVKNRIELTKTDPIANNKNEKQHKSRFEKVNNPSKNLNDLKMKSDTISEEIKYPYSDKSEESTEKRSGNFNKSIGNVSSKDKNISITNENSEKDVEDGDTNENKNVDSSKRNDSKNQTSSTEMDNDNESEEKISNENPVLKIDKNKERYEMEKESREEDVKDIRKSYSMTTRRLIIRREGDKLIAFENSPDYQEYEAKVIGKVKRKEIEV